MHCATTAVCPFGNLWKCFFLLLLLLFPRWYSTIGEKQKVECIQTKMDVAKIFPSIFNSCFLPAISDWLINIDHVSDVSEYRPPRARLKWAGPIKSLYATKKLYASSYFHIYKPSIVAMIHTVHVPSRGKNLERERGHPGLILAI